MNALTYILRLMFRMKWWLILVPSVVTLVTIYATRNADLEYETDTTVYTGVISGYGSDPSETNSAQDWNILNNAIQNIINTINSKETLKKLSLHLYANCMIYGSPDRDNLYIKAKHYRQLLAITPKDVRALIDKTSVEKTVANLLAYEVADRNNFVYGLTNWNHPYFSYTALQEKIHIKRVENSDVLHISYQADDPSIAFQTLDILNKIYPEEYRELQYGKTNNVIRYFETELARVGEELRGQEDSLTAYNVQNRVINYDKQTEAITVLDKEFALRNQDVLSSYNSAQAAIAQLEIGMDANMNAIKNNSEFLTRLNRISDLNYDIAKLKTVSPDSLGKPSNEILTSFSKELAQQEGSFKEFMEQYTARQYTKEGYANAKYVEQWVQELLKFKRAEAEVRVVDEFKRNLDDQYTHFSPIGSVLKRKERSISFIEQSYLSILSSLNAARLKLKSLEMNSATLKVINPPTYPLNSLPSPRKKKVLVAFIGSLLFVLGTGVMFELLDRTLRDRTRTQRITKTKVVAAFANPITAQKTPEADEKSSLILANQLYGRFNSDRKVNFINLMGLAPIEDARRVSHLLEARFSEMGLEVSTQFAGSDFHSDSRGFLIDMDPIRGFESIDIGMICHNPLGTTPLPTEYLHEAMVNLLIVRADSFWRSEYDLLLEDLRNRAAQVPLWICLTNADKSTVEEFTGLLPPYSLARKFEYQLSNLGLTFSKD
ncbi:GumC family protein [Sphingobacterium hotanense]|uniref:Lipopolysaccharide biosynthesis protein n=1 Tax=Sphingobacterium hotanense TaxID=649196 RepID=A0ABT7NHI7_9SPHI|nr:hypothetical protein [Sphingobacterium hotanense]MDM1046655.1 hypothetical protein [Sphingobacterium hotanense]